MKNTEHDDIEQNEKESGETIKALTKYMKGFSFFAAVTVIGILLLKYFSN